jgi:hypothetical protein
LEASIKLPPEWQVWVISSDQSARKCLLNHQLRPRIGASRRWPGPLFARRAVSGSSHNNINWTKGIDQKTGKPLDYDPSKDLQTYSGIANHTPNEPVRKVCPTILGGNNYWPSSYSPRTKLLYIPALTGCDDVKLDTEMHSKAKGWNGGTHMATDRLESNLTAIDRAAKLAAIPAGENPANRGVQSLL